MKFPRGLTREFKTKRTATEVT